MVDAIVSDMMGFGFNILSNNEYQIAFRKDETNFAAQLFLGSQFNSVPEDRAYFNIIQIGANVKITLDVKIVTNPNSGFEKYTQVTNSQWQDYLNYLKFRFNGDYLFGVSVVNKKKNDCFEIDKIAFGSSAEKEGLAVGDLILKVGETPVSKLSKAKLDKLLEAYPADGAVSFTIENSTGQRTVTLTKTFVRGDLQKKPEQIPSAQNVQNPPNS